MANPFVGEIRIFGGNYPALGWAFCDGSLQSISQNTVLYSLLGTTYGGDGQNTFALPDLRGRVPIHRGIGAGLSPRTQGEFGGTETVTLTVSQLPAHSHTVRATSVNATTIAPSGNIWAYDGSGATAGFSAPGIAGSASMNPSSISSAGGSQPHNNMQPTIFINYIISLEGIYPSRN